MLSTSGRNALLALGLSGFVSLTYGLTIFKMKQGSIANDFPDNVPAKQADGTEGNSEIDGALVRQLQSKRAECNNIIQKISSLEQERDDHDTAAGILQNFDVSRRCYRAVGGILMERTVADVVPELLGESRMLSKAMDDLVGKLKERQHDMEEFQEKHSLNMVGDGDDGLISHDSP